MKLHGGAHDGFRKKHQKQSRKIEAVSGTYRGTARGKQTGCVKMGNRSIRANSEQSCQAGGSFEISLSELADPQKYAEEKAVNKKKPNPILRANLIRLAILSHAVFLNTSVVHIREFLDRPDDTIYKGLIVFDLIMLTICSTWMTSNHRFEPDKQQRRKNVNIELGYCVIMILVALIDMYLGVGIIGVITFLPVMFVYILYINPKFMNRKLTK